MARSKSRILELDYGVYIRIILKGSTGLRRKMNNRCILVFDLWRISPPELVNEVKDSRPRDYGLSP